MEFLPCKQLFGRFLRIQKRTQIVAFNQSRLSTAVNDKHANDPHPERAVALWPYDQRPTEKSVQQTETHRQNGMPAWAFALSSFIEMVEISIGEQEQKLFIYSKDSLKTIVSFNKFTIDHPFSSKNAFFDKNLW